MSKIDEIRERAEKAVVFYEMRKLKKIKGHKGLANANKQVIRICDALKYAKTIIRHSSNIYMEHEAKIDSIL